MSVELRRRIVTRRKLPADVEDVVPGGIVHSCCLLTDELLLLVASFPLERSKAVDTWLLADGAWEQVRSEFTTFESSANDARVQRRRLMLLHVEGRDKGFPHISTLGVRSKNADLVLEPLDLARRLTTLELLVVEELAEVAPHDRNAIIDFLVHAVADADRSALKLSQALNRIREALRVRLPVSVVDRAEPRGVAVEEIWRLDERSFYISGWHRQEEPGSVSLTAISPEGERVEFGNRIFRYARSDVTAFYSLDDDRHDGKPGFLGYFETETPSRLDDGWIVQLRDSRGAVEVAAPTLSRDPVAARAAILGRLTLEQLPEETLRSTHVLPAISRLQQRLAAAVAVASIEQLGVPPPSPDVSVVVPLYRRVDFLEHQLAQFVHDPELHAAELIYVLDSPEQGDHLRDYAVQLHRLYGISFRIAILDRNGGFSVANNIGASIATGRLLLLLNSDVLPERPGWLGELVRFHDATPSIGALSPKLLYEDGSLQHAGLYFDRPVGSHVWANEHYFKGLHRDLPAANVTRRVPGVTGACMLMSAALFRELGGLRNDFVQGDYEDSDLCLRLGERGLESWYLPSVALYHLEGQSYPSTERLLASNFNQWLHTYLWNDAITRIESERTPARSMP